MSDANTFKPSGFFLQDAAAVVNWCVVTQRDNLFWPLKNTVVGCGSPVIPERALRL
ncbi:hypothetical protein [Pseudomonas atacamensis]|uniref:hypothetical protein n=1 Tax=Pseudomonas atacamensis TaxID=2565368 RepID=UPI002B1DDBE1|nr:hypothetical protein [Pseudomonas atacamensis]